MLLKPALLSASATRDDAARQYVSGRTVQRLEEAATHLAYWLEECDAMATVLSATMPDLRTQPLGFSCPAGQGSLLLRQAAVRAGLGSLGLNMALLTPRWGPRVFIAGVLTNVELEPDRPFTEELCLGLEECGRCAAICPEAAIPLEADAGAPLAEVRDLDMDACARSCQPYGPERMVEHLQEIFAAPDARSAAETARSKTTLHLFHNLTVLRHGGFTGCMRCEMVCPVGEDYRLVEKAPARQRDLPDGVKLRRMGDRISVANVGRRPRSAQEGA